MLASVIDRIKEFIRDYNSWERQQKRSWDGFNPSS